MKTVIVIPCFNEENRLDSQAFQSFVRHKSEVSLLFVDDGSTDQTATLLRDLATQPQISMLQLVKNAGKAEAVRQGMLLATSTASDWVGYIDADLATPPSEVERLIDIARDSPDCDCVFGSRIRLCGTNMRRRVTRHAFGRAFATLTEFVLRTHVYDSQAGAKFFRNSTELVKALEIPFVDRWSFDVELFGRLGRLGVFPARAREIPLQEWVDQEGSKVSLLAGVKATLSLLRVRRQLRKFSVSS